MNLNHIYCKFKGRHTSQVLIFPTQNLDSLETPWTPTTHTSVKEALGKQPNLISSVLSHLYILPPSKNICCILQLLSLSLTLFKKALETLLFSFPKSVSPYSGFIPSLSCNPTNTLSLYCRSPSSPNADLHSHLPV